jgi:PAS domain S-box-containing protein
VDVREDDGQVRRLVVEHVDPAKVRLAHELAERYPPDMDAPYGLPQVLRTGEPELVAEIPSSLLEEAAQDAEHLRIIHALQLCSYTIVPLVVQGHVWGAVSFVSAEAGRRFGPEDLRTAVALATRAALAIESAQLYGERVQAQERLEQQAAELEMQNEQLQEQGVELEMQAAQMQEQTVELAAANDALLAGNAALRESESRLTLALEGGRLGWWEWEIPQDRIRWSAPLERLYGLPPGGFDGRFETYARLVHPDDLPMLQARIERLLAERSEGYEIRHRIVRPDGAVRWIEAHAKLVLDARGEPLRHLGVAADVTAATVAEEERAALLAREQAARREAETANRAKAEFLATMSHELRTPLNAIAGYTDLLSMGVRGAVTPEQHEDLRRIRRSAQHLLSLINDILNFARLEAGQVELNLGRVSMHEVLASVEALVVPQLREKALRFTYEECDPSLTAHGDAETVQQILLNLLTNAVKFTEAGGCIHLSCGASSDAGPATVWVDVADTGRGIPPDKLETIFEPFVQIDRHLTHESQQGVGLGLAISRDLARAMHGDLAVRSEARKGTTFRLTLRRDG